MNFCNLAVIALVSLATSASAFSTRNPRVRSPAVPSSLSMIYPGFDNSDNIVAFTTTIHREEVNLEYLSVPQLQQMQNELETINERCTEEGTQTNPECDVDLKDERDFAILQIQRVLQERFGENCNLEAVDMEEVRAMADKPWVYPLQTIRQQIEAMEVLNCECTEDGNQTDPVCDVQLRDERDAAIETLGLYVKSVEDLLVTEGLANAEKEDKRKREETVSSPNICRDAHGEENAGAVAAQSFDMGKIRHCVNHPGSKSLVEMQTMLAQLETIHNDCTVEMKAERDALMESLVSMIHDAKMCMDRIKAFAKQGDKLDEVAVEEVMDAVINTIPNLRSSRGAVKPGSYYVGPTDEFLVQI